MTKGDRVTVDVEKAAAGGRMVGRLRSRRPLLSPRDEPPIGL